MYNLTKKYIYISEYFNPKPVEVLYHNERKDFIKEILLGNLENVSKTKTS